MPEKRKLTETDLRQMVYLSSPALSPEGSQAAYVVQKADESGDFVPRVFVCDLTQQLIRPLTAEGTQDLPRYAPDGHHIAWLGRHSTDDTAQIWLQDCRTGRQNRLTSLRHGVIDYAWSPDSREIALTARWWPVDEEADRQFSEMTAKEQEDWSCQRNHDPIVIENLMYKFDETYGIADQSNSHICLVNVATGRQRQLTGGCTSFFGPAWSPDSRQLVWYGKPYRHVKENRPALFLYDRQEKTSRQLPVGELLSDQSPAVFTADGRSVIYAAYEQKCEAGYLLSLFAHNLQKQQNTALIPDDLLCHGVGVLSGGRTALGRDHPHFQLDDDGCWLYFLSAWNASAQLYRLSLSGDRVAEQVTDGPYAVHAFCAPVGRMLLSIQGDLLTPAELYSQSLADNGRTRLTCSNAWLDEILLSEPQAMQVRSRDNQVQIHGYVVAPPDRAEGSRYPAVLNIHGGPQACFTRDFWFEVQLLAARGLAVLYCDPRGSSGYGISFAADRYAWGPESMDDLLSFVDAAVAQGGIDAERIGVTGGSYGGHMTNRLISATRRFRAAVTQRTLCNLATSYGTGDMGFIWQEEGKVTQMQNFMSRVDKSPITQIDRIQAPLLILHATHDYRCSFEQAEQLFVAMKDRHPDVPVRLVAFPGENHNLTRSGKMYFQIAHLSEMVQWFERFLIPDAGEASPASIQSSDAGGQEVGL